ncbi:MAG: hypothetical protein JRJ85_14300 [Deltaproteobacteria bacterium]|nr:hypothetical protein [Deltaproteobacteria bacterium]
MKPGVKTSEFWFATVTGISIAAFGILVTYGLMSSEQADVWMALVVAVIPAALAAVSYGYGRARQGVKESESWQLEYAKSKEAKASEAQL